LHHSACPPLPIQGVVTLRHVSVRSEAARGVETLLMQHHVTRIYRDQQQIQLRIVDRGSYPEKESRADITRARCPRDPERCKRIRLRFKRRLRVAVALLKQFNSGVGSHQGEPPGPIQPAAAIERAWAQWRSALDGPLERTLANRLSPNTPGPPTKVRRLAPHAHCDNH
jgi:hypothetical protein